MGLCGDERLAEARASEEISVTIKIKPRPRSRKGTPEEIAAFVRLVLKGQKKNPNLIAAWGDVEVVAVPQSK